MGIGIGPPGKPAVRRISTTWKQLVVRGSLDSGGYFACYVKDGRIDAAVGLNHAKDVRRVMPLIKSRHELDLDQLRDEGVDLRSPQARPQRTA